MPQAISASMPVTPMREVGGSMMPGVILATFMKKMKTKNVVRIGTNFSAFSPPMMSCAMLRTKPMRASQPACSLPGTIDASRKPRVNSREATATMKNMISTVRLIER